jgi:ankyrin repeat protein
LLKHSDKNVVNTTSKYFKQSPLVIAAYHGNDKVTKLLIDSGKADVHLRDASGDFALHHAVKQAKPEVVDLLLPKKNKEYSEENGVGYTTLDCAAMVVLSTIHR